jgi:SAM-dependent methyltransferase
MREASKTNLIRDPSFSTHYLQGQVLDIGAGTDLVCPWAQSFDVEDGDANHITRYFQNASFDAVHSSHSLEHMDNPVQALEGWWQLVKPQGHLIVVVPDEDLYEQGIWPSFFSNEHRSTFRLGSNSSWSPVSFDLQKLCEALPGAQVVSVKKQSHGYSPDLMFPKGLQPKRIKQPLKTWISLVKRVPFVGAKLKDSFLKSLIKHGYPYDQTQNEALAQIEIIVKKVAS